MASHNDARHALVENHKRIKKLIKAQNLNVTTLEKERDDAVRSFCKSNPEHELLKELHCIELFLSLKAKERNQKKIIKAAQIDLDSKAKVKCEEIAHSTATVKDLIIEHKWGAAIESMIAEEIDEVLLKLTHRLKILAERYEHSYHELKSRYAALEKDFEADLLSLGFTWDTGP